MLENNLIEEDAIDRNLSSQEHPWPGPTLAQKLARLRGSSIEHDLRPYVPLLDEITAAGRELAGLSDPALAERAAALMVKAREGQDDVTILDALLVETYALAREAARRKIGLHPYDVQVMAAIALDRGKVVEMQTGEGKTLAAVLPACLHALSGRGVHVLTFNDYLARRDAEWMGPIYRMFGLRVAWVEEGMTPAERRDAYRADITYLTAKEAGFDLLRDQRARRPEDLVHRPFSFALVDEADSLLIDEARVPLVLAGAVERAASSAPRLAELVRELEPGVHYELEAQGRNVELTEAGFDTVEAGLGCSLLAEESYTLLTELNCALHAQILLRRDVDYLVRGERIELIDEFTGRVVEDRHWPDGLQAALEAKEGLERRTDGRILGSITLQHLLSAYPKLCGMTGTAQDAARELAEVFGLGVVVIPTHRPLIRVDHPDRVFTHREAKEDAIVEEIRRAHAGGRPVLVGTASVAESERLAERMADVGISCAVLNAKNDELEASIVARAGKPGAVTIATNMAGRGTDIRLGGEDENERSRVVELGGLYVIGSERHESRRVDLQLRGRAGRQGDPGEARFFVSLEDELFERLGARRLIPPSLLPERRAEPLDHPIVHRELARAQRMVEGQNLEIRRTLWRYAEPVEEQGRELQDERRALLFGAPPVLWRDAAPERHAELVAAVGEDAVERAEVAVTLFQIDRAWSEHLALIASLREGIHLVGLGGEDPLTSFQVRTAEAFHQMLADIDDAVLASLDAVAVRDGKLDLDGLDLKGPASTWTYLINDDPFRQQLGRLLTGPGQSTLTIGAAFLAGPLFFLWLLVERWFGKRLRRGGG